MSDCSKRQVTYRLGRKNKTRKASPAGTLPPARDTRRKTKTFSKDTHEPLNPRHYAALTYHEMGLPITLCGPGSKNPISIGWPSKTWSQADINDAFAAQNDLNIGLILGPRSRLIDVEIDGPEGGAALLELFDNYPLVTAKWRSFRGDHYLFQWHPDLEQIGKASVAMGPLEFRLGAGGAGAQSLLPPSITDGFEREWVVPLEECTPAPLPSVVLGKLVERFGRQDCAVAREAVRHSRAEESTVPVLQSTDSNTNSVLSVISVQSTDSLLAQRILAVVERCVVHGPRTTNDKFMALAIGLKGLPELRETMGEDLEPYIRRWYEASVAHMQQKDWKAVWERWLYTWLWAKPGHDVVRLAYEDAQQEPLPECALKYPVKPMRQLVALCQAMQRLHADDRGAWYLSCRLAGEVVGVGHTLAAQLLKMLVRDKVLEIVEQPTTVRATRYRYLGE